MPFNEYVKLKISPRVGWKILNCNENQSVKYKSIFKIIQIQIQRQCCVENHAIISQTF